MEGALARQVAAHRRRTSGSLTVASRTHIRCPLYGFVSLDAWQREIIDYPAFQRLRRIRQLGMADMVYPSLTHCRFEHSLGTLHMATLLYDGILQRAGDRVAGMFGLNQDDHLRLRRLVQAAALLHDVGHGPFSHTSEPLMPESVKGGHEEYSAAVVREKFGSVIDGHPDNRDMSVTAEEVAAFLEGKGRPECRFWRGLLDGQVDADRMDYLLRDSLHAGVAYGRYDWPRVLLTATAVEDLDDVPVIGVEEGGWHAAEGLILARYSIFTQIYFHHTIAALEYDQRAAMESMLPDGQLPPLEEVEEFLKWDDWRVFGELVAGLGGEAGQRLLLRRPHVQVYSTSESPDRGEFETLEEVADALGPLLVARLMARRSGWYRHGPDDILVLDQHGRTVPLSRMSAPVRGLGPHLQERLYVLRENADEASRIVGRTVGER